MPLPPSPDWIPAALFAGWLLAAWLTRARLRDLPLLPEARPVVLPTVTLCIPARDEGLEVGRALDTWLAQDHPSLRILVVDDGSTDATAAELALRAQAHPERLRVLRNDHLPPGWLGKNHALDLATRQPEAREAQWLLFADADVHAAPDLLRRAFAFLEEHPADLLALLPGLDTVGLAERVLLPLANLGFLFVVPAARVADPASRAFCGVGGFTLVRRAAYDAVGGHAAAPMEPIDDMLLARRVKGAGFRNRVAQGGPALHLRMYHGLLAMVRALRKNLIARPALLPLAPVGAALAVAVSLSPVLLALSGQVGMGVLLWLLVPPLMGEVHQRFTGRPMDLAWVLWPTGGLVVAAGLAWACADRLRGINHWRGRNVPLR